MLCLLGFHFPSNWWELLQENGDKSLHSQALELTVRACAAKKEGVSTTMVLEHRISSTQKRPARLPGLLCDQTAFLGVEAVRPHPQGSSLPTVAVERTQAPSKKSGRETWHRTNFLFVPCHSSCKYVSRYSQQSFSSVNFRESDTSLQLLHPQFRVVLFPVGTQSSRLPVCE